jgi:hypothetical protein
VHVVSDDGHHLGVMGSLVFSFGEHERFGDGDCGLGGRVEGEVAAEFSGRVQDHPLGRFMRSSSVPLVARLPERSRRQEYL